VILAMHRLRKDEEGQTLVLAAIFGLVLMLCILGTVNLGRAVYDKVQLQTAADAAAYSQAAVEARVLNFTSYTNRAMVVHYASIMASSAYLTWLHYLYGGLKPLLTILKVVPYVGAVANVIDTVIQDLLLVMDTAVFIMTPLISAANIVLYGLQEGAWLSVSAGRLSRIAPEAHGGDSAGHPYLPIMESAMARANQTVFAQTRGHFTVLQSTVDSLRILYNSSDPNVQEARLHMLEIANSARTPWVAYGDRYDNPGPSPLARHWRWKIGCVQAGSVSRTELGNFVPKGGLVGTFTQLSAQVWSGERLQGAADCSIFGYHYKNVLPLFTFVSMDQLLPLVTPFNYSYFDVWNPKGLVGKIILWVFPGLKAALEAAKQQADLTKPSGASDFRIFFLSPYVYFSPRAGAKSGAGLFGKPGNFNQPDVIVGLAKTGASYNQELGASKFFGRKFSFNGKGGGKGAVDFRYTANDAPIVPGLPPSLNLAQGLNAFAAAQVYYHRPGDWREMPNFFNPLWGARLMPVVESNAGAKLLFNNPLFSTYLLH